ncbi:helix-turn-helix domain-containing protein [Kroppenstedtia pulmonis]|uniref:Helix-turn-helix domain-containing protein n=1 Tax=Kroppenstedtia pulmonis TaxID=1380685 RepID=A0A7D3XQ69_9BACL|nr:helix-turn-helix transcriptional regulator [Kroppenstedtia pulmonis]QKG84182.1 helix-turn-helix domain-containing protein [Kroppenstedtia pulmonis]
MITKELNELGEIIRKIRKEKGLRLEDLADENISPATISNIERGVPHVSSDKSMYLLEKMGLDLKDLPNLIAQQNSELKKDLLKLQHIESLLDLGDPEEGKHHLDKLHLEGSPYEATYEYLKGKYFIRTKDWKKAERSFFNAIRLYNQYPHGNIEACSFGELGLCSYYQNNIEQALRYTESEIAAFVEGQGREYSQYVALCNKAVYLEKLGRYEEAIQVVNELWEDIPKIESAAIVVNLHELRADLLRKARLYEKAITFAKQGIEIARVNKLHDRAFDLWTSLGNIYFIDTEQWEEAGICYQMALSLRNRFQSHHNHHVFVSAYTRYACLKMKQQQWRQAEDLLRQAIQLGEKLDSALRLTYAYTAMGDCKKEQKQVDEAISFYQKGLQLAQKHGYKKREYIILKSLATCYDGRDQKEFQSCLEGMFRAGNTLLREELSYHEDFK